VEKGRLEFGETDASPQEARNGRFPDLLGSIGHRNKVPKRAALKTHQDKQTGLIEDMENRFAADDFLFGQTGAILFCDERGRRRVREAAEKIAEPFWVALRRHSVTPSSRSSQRWM
jgi:hypothetical protein